MAHANQPECDDDCWQEDSCTDKFEDEVGGNFCPLRLSSVCGGSGSEFVDLTYDVGQVEDGQRPIETITNQVQVYSHSLNASISRRCCQSMALLTIQHLCKVTGD